MQKILLDTNAFHENWWAEGEAFTLLQDFCARGMAEAVVSEVSVREHVNHYRQKFSELRTSLRRDFDKWRRMTRNYESASISFEFNPDSFDSQFRRRLRDIPIRILPIPQTNHATLVERDLSGRKPFRDKTGYRDALIWLSIADDLRDSDEKLIVITNNHRDFADPSENARLHGDLLNDLKTLRWNGIVEVVESPKAFTEQTVKPILQGIQALEEGINKLATDIANGEYQFFVLSEVVEGSLELFEGQEANNLILADMPLEEPITVTMLEDVQDVEMTTLYPLVSGQFVLEGTATARGTVEGCMYKSDAFLLAEDGRVFVSTAHWNEHYSEVEISEVDLSITFSFKFRAETGDVSDFEITNFQAV